MKLGLDMNKLSNSPGVSHDQESNIHDDVSVTMVLPDGSQEEFVVKVTRVDVLSPLSSVFFGVN